MFEKAGLTFVEQGERVWRKIYVEELEKRIRWLWTFELIVLALFLSTLVGVAGFILDISLPAAALFLILGLLGVFYARRRYQNWGYELRDDYLYLEHGVIVKVESMVPYVRVQHVDTQRNALERVLGLSKVVVYTAGSRGADVRIPGLLPEVADEVQEELRKVAVDAEEAYGDGV